MKSPIVPMLAFTLLFVAGARCFAGEETLDIDTRFRAKIAKEKIKEGFAERKNQELGNGPDTQSCGSQNIGNIDTGKMPGTAPREVFVFAPNAINLVTAGGCH